MKDLVIVPTYDRPEYLWVCLENLHKAYGIENKEIWICEDNHADAPKDFTVQMEMLATIREAERLFGRPNVRYLGVTPHTYYGNSYNVIEAFRTGWYETSAEYIYLVEDDSMVTPDFFLWHEKAQAEFKPFVTCAGRINRSLNFQMNGPEAIDESIQDSTACVRSGKAYMSWATCFHRDSLHSLLKVLSMDYSIFKPGYEQDIAIQNFIQHHKLDSIWPYVPRAYHMGWYSYHRTAGMKFNGTLEEKVIALRKAIMSKTKIREMACLQEIDPFPKEEVVWRDGEFYLKADYR